MDEGKSKPKKKLGRPPSPRDANGNILPEFKRPSPNPKGGPKKPRDEHGNIIRDKPLKPRRFKAMSRGDTVAPSRKKIDRDELKNIVVEGHDFAEAARRAVGRPDTYTKEIADYICLLVSTTCYSMADICRIYAKDGIPEPATLWAWMWRHEEFRSNWMLAKRLKAHLIWEECIAIADNANEDVQRSKLRIATRMSWCAKAAPKDYGEAIAIEDTIQVQSIEQVKAQVEAIKRHTKEF